MMLLLSVAAAGIRGPSIKWYVMNESTVDESRNKAAIEFKESRKNAFFTEPMKTYDDLESRDDVFIIIARKMFG